MVKGFIIFQMVSCGLKKLLKKKIQPFVKTFMRVLR